MNNFYLDVLKIVLTANLQLLYCVSKVSAGGSVSITGGQSREFLRSSGSVRRIINVISVAPSNEYCPLVAVRITFTRGCGLLLSYSVRLRFCPFRLVSLSCIRR